MKPICRECYRILKPGGVLLSGLNMGIHYMVDATEHIIEHIFHKENAKTFGHWIEELGMGTPI